MSKRIISIDSDFFKIKKTHNKSKKNKAGANVNLKSLRKKILNELKEKDYFVKEENIKNKVPLLGFVGRYNPEKDHFYIVSYVDSQSGNCENLKAINKSIRTNVDVWALFKFKSTKIILDDLYEEISGMLSIEEFLHLYNYATLEDHNAFVIDGKAEKKDRFKMNFDTILRIE